jgi:hypothetical protein
MHMLEAQSPDFLEGIRPRRHAAGHHDHAVLPLAFSVTVMASIFMK